jgi:plastocyanin
MMIFMSQTIQRYQTGISMMDKTKIAIILCISVAAIIISSIAMMIPMRNTAAENNQSTYSGEKKEFWLFNSYIPGFNDTKMGMPHDVYSMPTMAVFKGDRIVIHFFNTEEYGGDHHSFTIIEKPYSINVEVSPGENKTITLDANTTGTFAYYCTFHQPTMRGQLIVQPPPY